MTSQKQFLVERIDFNPKKVKRLPLKEHAQINGAHVIAVYKVPISVCDTENANGRIYPRKLWERVVATPSMWDGKPGLLDHNTGEPSIKDVFCSFSNLHIVGSTVYADAYLIGDNGKMIHDLIQSGDKMVGLSSVGYGDFLPGTNVVDPDTYELERPADAVINPSAGIYASASDQLQTDSMTEQTTVKAPRKLARGEVQESTNTRQRPHKPASRPIADQLYKLPQNEEVRRYVESKLSAFPDLQEHKSDLLKARTLIECQRKTMRILSEVIQ